LRIFPTVVGRRRGHCGTMVGMAPPKEWWSGSEAMSRRGILTIKYPIEGGQILNWDDFPHLLEDAFGLAECTDGHRLVLPQRNFPGSETQQEKLSQILFETFKTRAVSFPHPASLSLYATGKTTGTVISIGETTTSVVPILESSVLKNASCQNSFGGRDINVSLQKIINESLPEDEKFTTVAERELIRDIKHQLAFVSLPNTPGLHPEGTKFELPDGRELDLTSSQLSRCTDLLFDPSLIESPQLGLHQLFFKSISLIESPASQQIAENIVFSGGSANLPRLSDRLQMEIRSTTNLNILPLRKDKTSLFSRLPPEINFLYAPKISPGVNLQILPFIGASMAFSDPKAHLQKWFSKEDYDEKGAAAADMNFSLV